MTRFRSFAAAGLAATALLAACGDSTGGGPAAVVNGIEISQEDVVDELEAIRGNTAYLEAYEASAVQGGAPIIQGTADDTFNTAFVATTLSTRILFAIVESEIDERGVTIDDECRARAADLAAERVAAASPDGDGAAVLDDFGDDYKAYLIDREADLLALQADLADQACIDDGSAAERYYEEHREQFEVETACVSHILVDTEAEAVEIAGLIAAGGDFASLAAERSTDTGSAAQGGELGCNPAGAFVPEFDAAAFSLPVGEVSAPIQTEFGYHLILVTERGVPDFEDVEQQVTAALAQEVETAFGEWFQTAVPDAEITVDERYGTWDAAEGTIVRPPAEGDPTATTGPGAEPDSSDSTLPPEG